MGYVPQIGKSEDDRKGEKGPGLSRQGLGHCDTCFCFPARHGPSGVGGRPATNCPGVGNEPKARLWLLGY